MSSKRRLAAILFSDIAGYTAMMQRDEEEGLSKLRRYRQVLEKLTTEYNGAVLKNYGDGSLSLFDSAVDAVQCALYMQQALQQEPVVPLRIGIHVGDVVLEDGDVYGDGVNLAARIESLGVPGNVLFTERVIRDIQSHPDLKTVSLGMIQLKNVLEPLEVFALANEGFPIPKPEQLPGWVPARTPLRRYLPWIALAALFFFLAIGLARRAFVRPGAQAAAPEKSIAILPFKDLSAAGDQAYLSEGIAEEILNALAQVPDLKVAGKFSAFAFKDSPENLSEIGRELGVRTLLEGSIRREGDRMRVMVRLVNAADGYQLWSQRYDGDAGEIFAIQDAIARSVAGQLQLVMDGGLKQQAPTISPEAYELFLKGRYLLSQRVDHPQEAAQFFRQAIALDANFAAAYAGLGDAYLWLGWGAYLPANEAFPKAGEWARQALTLDSSLAYAYVTLGAVQLWHDWAWENARQSFEKAIELNSAEGAAYQNLGWYYAFTGNFPKARQYLEMAISKDPLNLDYNIDLADVLRLSGAFQESLRLSERLRQAHPDNSDTYWILGLSYYHLGEYEKAVQAFEQTVKWAEGQPWAQTQLAMALAKTAASAKARQLLRSLEADRENLQTIPAELAMAYAALGDKPKALDLLEQAYRVRSNWMAYLLHEPLWHDLRQEPRFKALLSNMKFPEPARK